MIERVKNVWNTSHIIGRSGSAT